MRLIAGAIVTLGGAIQCGVSSLGTTELNLFATGGGVLLSLIGLLVMTGKMQVHE